MRILVVGANGRTGQAVCALIPNDELVTFEGDVLDAENVSKQMPGVDAVISVIGHVRGSSAFVQTDGMKNIVAAMQQHGVDRIVSLTGTGVRYPGDTVTLIDRLLNFAIGIIDPKRVRDGVQHAKVLEASTLNWTIIRVLKLTNGKMRDDWHLSTNGPTLPYVSRKTVAAALVFVVTHASHSRQAPIISRQPRAGQV